jgi:hypothetical protein
LAGIAGLLLFMGARIHLTEDRISRAKAAAESPTT